MTVSVTDLRDYIGAAPSQDGLIEKFLAQAAALIEAYIDDAEVPEAIVDQSVLEVGKELWHRKGSVSGIGQYANATESAPRLARDPLMGVYPILARWVGAGIA